MIIKYIFLFVALLFFIGTISARPYVIFSNITNYGTYYSSPLAAYNPQNVSRGYIYEWVEIYNPNKVSYVAFSRSICIPPKQTMKVSTIIRVMMPVNTTSEIWGLYRIISQDKVCNRIGEGK